ncbi:MAG: hypothetical protein RRB13_14925 [bacterium]|nr:hypothetical protein [bacterium]
MSEARAAATKEWWIRFVSATERRLVTGLDLITKVLESQGFNVDHAEFKVVNKKELKRPINPKFKDGPKEKVVIEERININTSYKHVRQLHWRVTKDPENVLLVQVERLKGEPMALPLIFESLFEEEREILVTGVSHSVWSQLTARPDPSFKSIPKQIQDDTVALDEIMARTQRKKGMQTTARDLLDLHGLKPEVMQTINEVAFAKGGTLDTAQAVNLILLSDLYSRYSLLLWSFWEDVMHKRQPPGPLAKQFSVMTHGVPTEKMVQKFAPYLDPEKKYKTNEMVFGGLYQALQGMEDKSFKADPKLFNAQTLYSLIRGVVIVARSQLDPPLWEKCKPIYNPDDERSKAEDAVHLLVELAAKVKNESIKAAASSSQSLQDLYDSGNADRYLKEFPLAFAQMSPAEKSLSEKVLARRFGFRGPQEGEGALVLFQKDQPPLPELIHPLPTLGSVYGYTLFRLLCEAAEEFFEPGFEDLKARFGAEFFEISYYSCVTRKDLPLGRSQWAQWLSARKWVEDWTGLGYKENPKEEPMDPWLTQEALMGEGNSVVPEDFGPVEFSQAFDEARQKYLGFFGKLKKHNFAGGEDLNPAKVLLNLFEQGIYDINSLEFRKALRETYLGEEIEEVIENSTQEMREEMQQAAKGDKLVLFLPDNLAGFFYMAHRFNLRSPKGKVKIHLLLSNQAKGGQLKGINKKFAENLGLYLKSSNEPYRQGLIQAIQMLGEYQKASQDLLRFLGLYFFDRFLHAYHEHKAKRSSTSPAHIKYWVPDNRKMVIGHTKNLNLNKLLNFTNQKPGRDGEMIHSQSLAQFLQGIYYHESCTKRLTQLNQKTQKLGSLFERFSPKMKETNEYRSFKRLLDRYLEICQLPVLSWTGRVLSEMEELSLAMKRQMEDSKGMDAPVDRLFKEWSSRYPDDEGIVKPFRVFSHERVKTDNFLVELTNARDLLAEVKVKKVFIFVTDAGKKAQVDQIHEVLEFLREHAANPEFYLEASSLSTEAQQALAREINPSNFFNAEKIEPVPKGS